MMLVIDVSCLCYRARYAMPELRTARTAEDTEIIFGFWKQLLGIADHFQVGASKVVLTWDSKQRMRCRLYAEYKANRNKRTEEEKMADAAFHAQVNKLHDMTNLIGWTNSFQQIGYEADDIIAALVMSDVVNRWIMVTGDEDMFQMLKYADQYIPAKKLTVNIRWFNREYGIGTDAWVLVKCLAGCTSDNVPGIPGIGEVNACKWIRNELKEGSIKHGLLKEYSEQYIQQNTPLVKLPFRGTKTPVLTAQKLNWISFRDIALDWEMRSLLYGREGEEMRRFIET